MVRGSVPWFWDRVNNKQNDLTKFFEIELLREFEMHEAAFKFHIKDLVEKYHKVVLINLLDTNNSYEHSLIKFYEFLLKNNKSTFKKCLKYQYINYKKESVHEDIEKNKGLKSCAEAMKFLWINGEEKVKWTQEWVIRFNSLNCLHRTNHCQEKVSIIILKKIINKLHDKYIIDETKIKWNTLIPKIEGLYRVNSAKLCIESGCHCIINQKNEDDGYLQAMYGQVSSLEKYFTNFVSSIQVKEDNLYQEALGRIYEVILLEYIRGINISQEGLIENDIDKKLLEEEHKYSRIHRYKFGFLTWNLAGKNYDKQMDFKNTLRSEDKSLNKPADIYFIGFQETRKLNAFAILKGANKTRTSKDLWG